MPSSGQVMGTNFVKKTMNAMDTLQKISLGFLLLMGLAFAKTGIASLIDPVAVLAQVGIKLDNNSALASMRAVYGGMHLVFGLFVFWAAFKNRPAGLGLTALYTAGFVLGRLVSAAADGSPNSFVLTWLFTEAFCLAVATGLFFAARLKEKTLTGLESIPGMAKNIPA